MLISDEYIKLNEQLHADNNLGLFERLKSNQSIPHIYLTIY